jgi:hypothetical protein
MSAFDEDEIPTRPTTAPSNFKGRLRKALNELTEAEAEKLFEILKAIHRFRNRNAK